MKKIFLSLTIAMSAISVNAQSTTYADFVYVTPQRDTIFLDKNSPTAWNLYDSWNADKTWNGVNPSIIFVDTTVIIAKKEEDLLPKRRKNKRNK